jgi:hypothetical protein
MRLSHHDGFAERAVADVSARKTALCSHANDNAENQIGFIRNDRFALLSLNIGRITAAT